MINNNLNKIKNNKITMKIILMNLMNLISIILNNNKNNKNKNK